MSTKLIAAIVLGLVAVLALAVAAGGWRWRARTRAIRHALQMGAQGAAAGVTHYQETELSGLPRPVARFLRTVLQPGQAIASGGRLAQEGSFQMGKGESGWRPFTADERFTSRPPGFDWDARIAMAPGLTVFVRDAYLEGQGILRAQIAGLLTVANVASSPRVAEGELMRYLAEAAWYPTALLPSQGVVWEAIDAGSARASLTDGEIRVGLEFRFGADGLITSAFAPRRWRWADGKLEPAPWVCRYEGWHERGGMLVPIAGEVAWQLPSGPAPYWRGRVTAIEHDLPAD